MAQCPKEECQGESSHFVHHDSIEEVNVHECHGCGDEFDVPC